MIPNILDIIKSSGIHPSRIFNIYMFGSTIYGTNDRDSDFDLMVVANNSIDHMEIKKDNLNIHIYTPSKFKSELNWHKPTHLECFFAPNHAILKKDMNIDFILNVERLRHATSHTSSNSWVKAKKKLIDGEYRVAIKSIFHSLRIPLLSTQISTMGKIWNFSEANWVWDELKSRDNWTWSELDDRFRLERNKIMSDFRKSINT